MSCMIFHTQLYFILIPAGVISRSLLRSNYLIIEVRHSRPVE
jgi:hypothetical protein